MYELRASSSDGSDVYPCRFRSFLTACRKETIFVLPFATRKAELVPRRLPVLTVYGAQL